jgi:hypothetical protein
LLHGGNDGRREIQNPISIAIPIAIAISAALVLLVGHGVPCPTRSYRQANKCNLKEYSGENFDRKEKRLSQQEAICRKDAGSAVPTSRDSNGAEGSEW